MNGPVIFDCDGVLVDSEPISLRCTAAALTAAGYPIGVGEVRHRFLGISTAAMVREVERDTGRPMPPGFVDGLRHAILAAFERELRPMDGVAGLLDRLDRPACVASSSVPERIHMALAVTGLIDRLAPNLFSATMVACGKPAPDLFLLAASRMGAVPPAHCIVVEDSPAGVRAGRAAGMTVFGFVGGSHLDPAVDGPGLYEAGAHRVFRRMAELEEAIRAVP
ncbi:HAD family hydrolase [Azospirillum halopraeferens]|uniref:HAD family hydrolase n=1 Tax=Azospirillum halopraeferens TaxID=34010 RepID=UPI0003F987AD|nr:HAD family hydrolase [Azospirillum halopraeferens]